MFDPTFFSLISHAFANPLLYTLMINCLIEVYNKDHHRHDMTQMGQHGLYFGLLLGTYIICNCTIYFGFMTCVYVVLRVFDLTPNFGSFIYTQYCYESPLRHFVVGLLVLHTALWGLGQRIWKYKKCYFGPALIAAAIIQVFLFFKNLY